ncbi:MAG: tRNA 2-selenouridine(34) synthase MnmH, partial [Finegoldia magna]|nr:tRNA 2-selenouridine(34) synthase MnmH [Finegoldia magna]MDD6905694.1 tRNA 2-selenouridine(34) synthase MnmH [Finegoldia magna]
MFVANTYEELINMENIIFVDVRSEYEFKKETIPGSINIPILNNDERIEISTIYDAGDHECAKKLAIRYASVKLEDIYVKLLDLSKNYNVCLFCYRGSMRSTVLFNIMKSMGLSIYRLKGGYKAYRKYVIENLDKLINSHEYVNINGYTGVGKTEILNYLENSHKNVLNLEQLANHRGSILGNAGLNKQPSQKMFESLLFDKLKSFNDEPVFVECESSKIGRINIPKSLRQKYNSSHHQVMINSSLQDRIDRIKTDYLENPHALEDIKKGINHLSKYIGNNNSSILIDKLENEDYDSVIEALITKYYDINYAVKAKDFELEINNDDSEKCAEEIMKFYAK